MGALRNVVSDAGLLSDLTARVMEVAAGEVVAGRHSTPAVSLDWILDQLVAAWTGANTKAEEELQELFVKADDNGDGVLSLSEFQTILRMLPGGMQSSMNQDFEIYNECIEQSENAHGGDSDLILPEVFTRVCMAKQLMPGALSMLRLSKASVQEESSPKREPQRRSSTGSIGGASALPARLSRRESFVM